MRRVASKLGLARIAGVARLTLALLCARSRAVASRPHNSCDVHAPHCKHGNQGQPLFSCAGLGFIRLSHPLLDMRQASQKCVVIRETPVSIEDDWGTAMTCNDHLVIPVLTPLKAAKSTVSIASGQAILSRKLLSATSRRMAGVRGFAEREEREWCEERCREGSEPMMAEGT